MGESVAGPMNEPTRRQVTEPRPVQLLSGLADRVSETAIEGALLEWKGKVVKGLRGREGQLRCRRGHPDGWALVRRVGNRLDFRCLTRVVSDGTGREGYCRSRGTVYLHDKTGLAGGDAPNKYQTLRAVVLALGKNPGATARQVAASTGLSVGAVSGCLARCLKRGLATCALGTLIPSGHRTKTFSLTANGEAYYRYYKG